MQQLGYFYSINKIICVGTTPQGIGSLSTNRCVFSLSLFFFNLDGNFSVLALWKKRTHVRFRRVHGRFTYCSHFYHGPNNPKMLFMLFLQEVRLFC